MCRRGALCGAGLLLHWLLLLLLLQALQSQQLLHWLQGRLQSSAGSLHMALQQRQQALLHSAWQL